MNHMMRKVSSIAALVFTLMGTGPVMAQGVMTDVAFLRLCAKGTTEEISQALEAGANIGAKDAQGTTALMYAAKGNKDSAVMKMLLEAAAEFNEQGVWKKGKNILGFKTVDVNDRNKKGMTALMYAIENNVPGVVQVLLENRANINVKDIELAKKRKSDAQEVGEMLRTAQRARNDVAFLRLCAKGAAEDVRQALEFGANIGAQDAQNVTTLMYAARDNANPEVMNALLMAATKFKEKGLWQKGKSKLGFKTVDINDGNKEGITALMYAVENNSPDVVRMLLAGGADANVKNKQGITALMFAVEKSSPDMVQVLLDAEADVNEQDKTGRTVLMFAVERVCNPEVVEKLLKAGANIDAMDKGGMTALMWAETEKSCSEEVMKLLQTPKRVGTGI